MIRRLSVIISVLWSNLPIGNEIKQKIPLYFTEGLKETTVSFYKRNLSCYGEAVVSETPPLPKGFLIESDARILFDPLSLMGDDKNTRIISYREENDRTRDENIFFSTPSKTSLRSLLCSLSCDIIHETPPKSCLFLDRDGVIIEDTGYPHDPEKLVLIESIVPVIKYANSQKAAVIIVSNQSGIGRGFFSEQSFYDCKDWIEKRLHKRGCHIDDWHFCPFHKEAENELYRRDSPSRKPNPGMVLKNFRHFPLDLGRSAMIGDKNSDRIPLLEKGVFIISKVLQSDGREDILKHLRSLGI